MLSERERLVKEGKILEAEELAKKNPDLHRGIQVLFNGDAWLLAPQLVPREDWIIVSPHVIVETEESKQERDRVLEES